VSTDWARQADLYVSALAERLSQLLPRDTWTVEREREDHPWGGVRHDIIVTHIPTETTFSLAWGTPRDHASDGLAPLDWRRKAPSDAEMDTWLQFLRKAIRSSGWPARHVWRALADFDNLIGQERTNV
jgi:hypothetical protein